MPSPRTPFLLASLSFGLASCQAQTAPNAPNALQMPLSNQNSRLGINLTGANDYNAELPFHDLFKQARPWISQMQGKPWGQGPKLELDENGFPKSLEAGAWADSPFTTLELAPLGKYTVLYDGEGEIDFWPPGNRVINGQSAGQIFIEATKTNLFLQIKKTNPQNPVRNIRVLPEEFGADAGKNLWREGFLKMWRPMNTYRFMEWNHANDTKPKTWETRGKTSDMSVTRNGVPLEWMIDLCNRQGINPWFNMPWGADENYIRQFAKMTREKLDPTLHVYIELSNEVWNSGFPQTRAAQEKAKELGIPPLERPWEGGAKFYARRSVEMFKIWEQEFGGKERLVRVLAWQAANPWWSENIVLPFEDAYKNADALAIAPYFGAMPYPKGNPSSDEMATWSVEKILDHTEQTSLPEAVKYMEQGKKIADKFGLRLVCYEGGQHLVGTGGGENNEELTKKFHAVNRHPRMGELYSKYLDGWNQIGGGDLMCLYNSVGTWSKWGSWGLAENYLQTPNDAPKLRATLDWLAKNPLENAPPEISGLQEVSATTGQPLALEAKITDDGETKMTTVVGWSASGPAPVEFSAQTAQTKATFSKAGVYTLQIRASDGFARGEKSVRVTVR